MACNAHHIPGADARRRRTSGFTTHSCTQQIKVHRPFLPALLGWRVSSSTGDTGFPFSTKQPPTWRGLETHRKSATDFLYHAVCTGPSAEEGVWVRHVKMTRRETSSAREFVCLFFCVLFCFWGISLFHMIAYQPPFLTVFTKSGYIIAPENRTLDFLNRQGQGQRSDGNVKMSLNIQAVLAGVGGWARPVARGGASRQWAQSSGCRPRPQNREEWVTSSRGAPAIVSCHSSSLNRCKTSQSFQTRHDTALSRQHACDEASVGIFEIKVWPAARMECFELLNAQCDLKNV